MNDDNLGRCTGEYAFPVRWADGQSRVCPMHADISADLAAAAEATAGLMVPGARWRQGGNGRVISGDGRQ